MEWIKLQVLHLIRYDEPVYIDNFSSYLKNPSVTVLSLTIIKQNKNKRRGGMGINTKKDGHF